MTQATTKTFIANIRGGVGPTGPVNPDSAPADEAVAGWLSTTGGSATQDAADARYAPRQEAFSGLFAALTEGRRSVAVGVVGDSTGNADDEWVYLLATEFASRYPAYTVHYREWDAISEFHSPIILQTGALGERYVNTVSSSLQAWPIAGDTITGDIDIRVKVAATDWTPTTDQTLVARFAAAPERSFRFMLTGATGTPGTLKFDWSTDGSTLQTPAFSSVPVGATDGATTWVRVIIGFNNGAGGYDIKFYTAPDGVTWTQLGTTVTRAGTSSLAPAANTPYELGGRSFGTAELFNGKFYVVQVRRGIGGGSVVPCLPELWSRGNSSIQVVGSPVLTFVNGSQAGAGIDTMRDATRLPQMTPDYGQAVTILSTSHNELFRHGRELMARIDLWASAVAARVPAPFALVTQNPRLPVAGNVDEQAVRRGELLSYAHRKGWGSIDTYAAFLADSRGLAALINSDGIHPNPAGSRVWTDAVVRGIGL